MNTYNDQVKQPPAFLKANTCFIIIITCVASAKAGLVVGRTHEWTLVGYFKFPKFLGTLNFQNQLRNKPHLHIKEANKLKMRFIPLNFIWDLLGTYALFATNKNPFVRESVCLSVNPSAILLGRLVFVICNSKSFHSFLLKLCNVIVHISKMCTSYFVHNS